MSTDTSESTGTSGNTGTSENTTSATGERTRPRLQARYLDDIRPALREQFGYGNVMQVPGLVKVVVNMG
ncbi:MAG: hypothetical protein ACLGIA_13805, partial [Actinomycetes bacterium]